MEATKPIKFTPTPQNPGGLCWGCSEWFPVFGPGSLTAWNGGLWCSRTCAHENTGRTISLHLFPLNKEREQARRLAQMERNKENRERRAEHIFECLVATQKRCLRVCTCTLSSSSWCRACTAEQQPLRDRMRFLLSLGGAL